MSEKITTCWTNDTLATVCEDDVAFSITKGIIMPLNLTTNNVNKSHVQSDIKFLLNSVCFIVVPPFLMALLVRITSIIHCSYLGSLFNLISH